MTREELVELAAKLGAERDLWKAEWTQISETARLLKIDADRYRYLRQPGNAIVYAKDANAWGMSNPGHVRYDSPGMLDTAIDRALSPSAGPKP